VTAGIEEATGTPRPDTGAPGVETSEPAAQGGRAAAATDTIAGTRFAHASETEMARILDFYAVRWEYEPMTFPILWNTDGDVVESFSPDFYLPDLELFLEMTTLKQRLVRKKNRKLRRLRALYPDIRIKLFYARDFRAMMLKYGRYALFESLAGTSGQVVPERASRPASVPPAGDASREPVADTAPEPATDLVLGMAPGQPIAEPVIAGATARSRAGRRRRRRAGAQVGAEQESGA
jgi:hypothetical protein